MRFYNSTRGLIVITLLCVFSSTMAKPLGISGPSGRLGGSTQASGLAELDGSSGPDGPPDTYFSSTIGLDTDLISSVGRYAPSSAELNQDAATSRNSPNICNDTPGYNKGAAKQFFRGTRDAGDAALDGANGLLGKILGDSSLDSSDGKDILCTEESSFSGIESSFDQSLGYAKHGLIDAFEGIGNPERRN